MMNELKPLPHSISAEQAILGSCLIEPKATMPCAIRNLKIDDFYLDKHRIIYNMLVSFWNEEKPIDFVTIAEGLKKKNILKNVGGATYVNKLIDAVATTANIEYYIGMVKDHSLDRKLEKLIGTYKGEEGKDIKSKILDLKTKLTNIEGEIIQKATTFKDDLHSAIEELERQRKSDKIALPTGILDLDDKIGGIKAKRLSVVGGRPRMGKSTLVMNIGLNLVEDNQSVLICSLQLSTYDIIVRILSNMARIPNWKFELNKLTDDDWGKIMSIANKLYQYPLHICDKFLTMGEIESLVEINRPKILIVDFIQQLKLPGIEDFWKKLTYALVDFKRMAKEYDCHVMLVSQLSREFDKRPLREPRLSDFSESGGIEQQAELMIIVDWPSRATSINPKTKKEWTDEEKKLVNIFLAKNNFGPEGKFKLFFDAPYYTYKNYTYKQETNA